MENNNQKNNLFICKRRNQFILNLATFLSANFNVDQLAEELDKSQSKLNEAIERIQAAGNDNLKVLDLTKVANIADNELFSEDYDQLINFINISKENVKTLESLDFDVNDMSFKDVALICYQVSKIPSIVANTLMNTVLNPNAEEEINDLYINAIANICSERMNRERFLTENGLIPEGKTWQDVTESYSEAYNNWVVEEAVRILMNLKVNPAASVAIYPEGVSECKARIKELLPIDADTSFLDDLSYEDMGGDIFMKSLQDIISNIHGLDVAGKRDLFMKVYQEVVTMNDRNSVGSMETGTDPNDPMSRGNIISAVNLPEATAHIFFLASNDLYDENGVIEPSTEYLMDIIGAVFDKLDIVYGKYTAARILSTFILAVPYAIASSMLLKVRDRNFMNIANNLGQLLLNILAEKQDDARKAQEKGDTDGNI